MTDSANQAQTIKQLSEALLKTDWPKCNQVVDSLKQIGTPEAIEALFAGLATRKHHTRSAIIKGLASLGNPSYAERFERFLDDNSYEVRMDAKEAIAKLTGKPIQTARGE